MAGRVRGNNANRLLLLTTVGRRSGVERTNPVAWFTDPDGGRLIVASANGAADNPAWYYNLAAHPDAHIEVGGETSDVTAEQLHGEERDRAWQVILAEAPRFDQYTKKTDREIPVIRLRSR
ncbi:nitroreductase family deazaflavin-dependent oxidoreductase [Actinoplanes bogorensis]|uniref:Nitroreductase family deazaflavin-dependent oxidoreductase n=2 Tax=Paractinoplanes bogorensis TaxID=1610840 RepID=A0ABS5YLK0_9ACTN|nr:nitroreductase family deazaflavin-dependent oxidoreductase [Actinoplanes bogorensis]